ncbi:MAG: TIGR03960 family B12-binding radical SAM protein [Candidatus Zixiibacteriota bacterium]
MRKLLEERFFPFVIRPGRYSGGEPGQIVKDPKGRVNYLHAYPDKYEVGQSYVGLQSLYHIVNQDDRFLCERVFAVDTDAEALMRREAIPLFSLETSRPAREFDAIGFTLVDEMVATNTLAMLELAGLALRADQRGESDPIIMAGGPAVYNPEPLAPFFDLFFIGDAEEGLPQMLAILHELRGHSKEERLRALAERVESVYVPRFYDTQAKPVVPFAPETIKARVIPDLKPEYYPSQPLVPLVETVHDHLGVEIMRGCPQGCKFCYAGPIYRPVRIRSVSDISRQVETQLNATGYSAVSLLALSATDYPDLEKLVISLSSRLAQQRVSISLPSLRPGSVSPTVIKAASTVRKFGLTIAPEAGTERLRLVIRKDFPDEAILDTARIAFSNGWTSLKLYFMVGLPTETEDDLRGIADLCGKVLTVGREYTHKAAINVTLSPFVPKAHTPFQWDEALPEKEVFERIRFVKRQTRSGQVQFRFASSQMATISALIGRGGREMADVIETAFRLGCRFDSWGESFDFAKWTEALERHNIDTVAKMKPIPFTQRLPWSHIAKGKSVEHLIEERQKTSLQLQPHVAQMQPPERESSRNEKQPEFGRAKKRVIVKDQTAPTKNRVRVRWSKSARFKYMSHLDNLHLMERALRRARLPVAYSQGHNPIMKLSLGPPLPLGFTSEAEYIDITLETGLMPYMIDNLRRQLPQGIEILEARTALEKKASLSGALNRAEYAVSYEYWSDREQLEASLATILASEKLECERGAEDKVKTVNLRPGVYTLQIETNQLVMVLGLGEGSYAKPTEVATFLTESLTVPIEALPFHRRALYRVDDFGRRIDPMDL